MEEQNVWQDIEGAIKHLSTALHSLPDELKSRALKLLGNQLSCSGSEQPSTSSSNELKLALKIEDSDDEDNEEQSILSEYLKIDGNDVAKTAEKTAVVSTTKRRRGRPPPKLEKSEEFRPEPKMTRSTRLGGKNLRSGRRKKVHVEDTAPKKCVTTRRAAKEASKAQTTNANKAQTKEENKARTTRVPIKAQSKVAIGIKLEDDKDLNSKTTIDDEISDDHRHSNELNADNLGDSAGHGEETNVLKSRKRGRPRKSDVAALLNLKIEDSEKNESNDKKDRFPHKNPPGRPRQSTYSSGHTPRAKSFRCMECDKMLATKQSYREHQRQHTGEGFMCDSCGQKFTTNSGFVLHKRYHSDDPHIYKCSKCKYIVSSQQLLDDHYQLRHDPNRPKSHICDVCGKAFHGATQLEKHLFSHSNIKPYACDQCSFSTAYPGGLEKHKYNVHVSNRKLYRCELCGIQLKSKGTYIEHIGRHFNQRKKKCEICEKTFPNASQLAAHRRCHLEPSVPCEVCGKKLRSKHKLKVHELIHTGQKDFACPYCTYVTYVKHNLKKHCMARHKVDYPPLLTQKMKKYKLGEVTTDGFKDPLAVKCLNKLSSTTTSRAGAEEAKSAIATETTSAAMTAVVTATSALDDINSIMPMTAVTVATAFSNINPNPVGLIPVAKVEMATLPSGGTADESKMFVREEKMYVTLSTIDRSAILDFRCPPGTSFYPTSLYLPTLINGDQQTI